MRRWAGTISAKMGLLQAGAAQLLSRPQVTMATEYIITVIGSPLCGRTCSAAVAHASAVLIQHVNTAQQGLITDDQLTSTLKG